ncbi:hypothetical protein CASFOL_005033 [Castilleja foliolosa]|uniref:Alpha-D-phosphohexomutase C-terminal domain-containing protein n=1 Tax=Castilleja foliolosa TaxID=1961234 RepID=A0ABD3E2A1_9LAMI
MGWSIHHKWNELYQDLPSRQLKVKVVDRTAVITENVETVVVSPVGIIQEAIDAETAKYTRGRCFIWPSGTEDVVRVHAEASTQEETDNLAHSVLNDINAPRIGKVKYAVWTNKYAQEILQMEDCNSTLNPVVPGTKLSKDEGGVQVDNTMFKQIVGSLMLDKSS